MKGRSAHSADDLLRIRGINAKLAQRLQECGISTFAQLASLNAQEIAEHVGPKTGVTATQITRQDWIGQARLFAAEPSEPVALETEHESEPAAKEPGLHATSYVLELYLDGDRRVNRTRILDVRSGEEDMWQCWDENRLLEFFANRPELNLRTAESVKVLAAPTIEQKTAAPEPAKACTGFCRAVLSSSRLEIVPKGETAPSVMLVHGQPFQVHLTLGVARFGATQIQPLDYSAVIMAKSMESPQILNLAEATGSTDFTQDLKLDVRGLNPPPGLYRTQALVTVFDSQDEAHAGQTVVLRSLVEGSVLRVD